MAGRRRETHWEKAFIAALRTHGVVSHAATQAKVSRPKVYARRKEDPTFAERWDEAMEDALDALEVSLHELVRDEQVDAATRFRAISFTLARRRPERWAERSKLEVGGPGGGPVAIENTVHVPSPEVWAEVLAIRQQRPAVSQEDEDGHGATPSA